MADNLKLKDSIGESMEGIPPVKQRKTTRRRRGLANRKSNNECPEYVDEVITKKSSIYSSRVSKCFSNFQSNPIDIMIKSNDSDVEDECQLIQPKMMKDPGCHLDIDSDDPLSKTGPRTDDVSSLDRSRSPSPPPTPHEIQYRLRTRSATKLKRGVKKALMNLDGLGNILETGLNVSVSEGDLFITHVEQEQITVKIKYRCKLHRYSVPTNETFCNIISCLADDLNVDDEQIMLVHGERTITPADTPASLQLNVADILECHISSATDSTTPASSSSAGTSIIDDPSMVKIFIQSRNSRQRTEMNVDKTWPLTILMHQYAKEKKVSVSNIRFLFDGEDVSFTDTPQSLDMENGDCMDVIETICLDIT